jgi:urease beta subunit
MEPDDDLFTFDSIAERRAMRLRQIQIGRRMQLVAAAALAEWERKIADGQPLNIAREDAMRLMATGEQIERLGLGDDPDDDLGKAN